MGTVKSSQFMACDGAIRCDLTTSELDGFDAMRYTTYGVRFTDEAGRILLQYEDISTDRQYVEDLIDLCTKYKVSGAHLADVLNDYLL